MTDQPLMTFTSRTAVRNRRLASLGEADAGVPNLAVDNASVPEFSVGNARVAVYPDRIEWEERRSRGGLIGYSLSLGMTALLFRRRSTHVIPVGQIQAATTERADLGVMWVRVAAAGEVGAFQVSNRRADQLKDLLLQLMNGHAGAEPD